MYKHLLLAIIIILSIGCTKTDKESGSIQLQGIDSKYMAAEGKRGYMVFPGQSPIDSSVLNTPFSDRTRPITGSIRISGYDVLPLDSSQIQGSRQDELQNFIAEFVHPETRDLYTFIITDLANKQDFESFGGIGIDKMIHGDTGTGTNLLPKTFAHMVVFGLANILKNGAVVERAVPIEIFVSQGIRNDANQLLLLQRDTYDQEIHLIITYEDSSPIKSSPEGFFYLYFEDVNVYRHTVGQTITNAQYSN